MQDQYRQMMADSKYVGWINTLEGAARFIREMNKGSCQKMGGCSERARLGKHRRWQAVRQL